MGASVVGNTLKNKKVLITGATGGIGEATALRFALEGANVYITGRNEEKLREVSENIFTVCSTSNVKYIVIDMLDEGCIEKEIRRLKKEISYLDVLVNNAGVLSDVDRHSRFRSVTPDEFEAVWNMNCCATIKLTEEVMNNLKDKELHIINVSSICSETRKLQFTPYGMSKAVIRDISNSIEKQNIGVYVNTILPGTISTRMTNYSKDSDITLERNSLYRVGIPEEVAAIIAFVASDVGKYISSNLHVSACEVL